MNQNHYFMGTPNHRPGAPMNSSSYGHREMHMMQTNHIYGQARNSGPVNRYPNHFTHCQDGRPRPQFGGNRFRPYFRHGIRKQWNGGGPPNECSRFVHPSIPMNCNAVRASFSSSEVNNGRRQPCNPEHESISRQPYPQYVLRTTIEQQREECHARHIGSHFTEVCASVNFTIRTGSYNCHNNMLGSRGKVFKKGSGVEDYALQQRRQTQVRIGKSMKGSSDDDGTGNTVQIKCKSAVAVGSFDHDLCSSPSSAEGSQENADNIVLAPLEEEEYEPENPDINTPFKPLTYKDITWSAPSCPADGEIYDCNTDQDLTRMASCDDEGFHEAFVGVCISRYPFGLGRMVDVAGYGVWFSSDGQKRNFSGVLKESRPQNVKAIMIHGSARTVEVMKNSGYSRVRVNLETDYLNKSVLGWISKYMENPKAQPSNWDEVKYHPEILELCSAATGMVIKWSHCSESSIKKSGIEKARHLAKKATDTWMKDLLLRQEAVGTTTQ